MVLKGWRSLILNTAAPAFFAWLGLRGFDLAPETQYELTLAFMAIANIFVRWITTTAIFQAVQDPVLIAYTPAGPVVTAPQPSGPPVVTAPETDHAAGLDIIPVHSDVPTPPGREAVILTPQAPPAGSG